MDSKIKIKIGSIEIEYEGNEGYLKDELPDLIDKLVALKGDDEFEKEELNTNEEPKADSKTSSSTQIQMSSNSIAAKMGVNSGPDLILVACAHLTFVQGKDTFHRSDILNEMKTASNYYKQTHNKNLSQGLKSLVGNDKLIERTKDTFALSANQKKSIKSKLNV